MFSLLLFNKLEVYSTKKLAEKNASTFLRKFVIDNHWLWATAGATKPIPWNRGGVTAEHRMDFEECFQREDYEGCVKVWNTYSKDSEVTRPELTARIKEVQLNKLFT